MDVIQLKRGKLSDWQAENPVLEAGEAGIVFDSDTLVPYGLKVGNGFLNFNDLPFITGGGSADTYTREQIDEKFAGVNGQIEIISTDITTILSKISAVASPENKLLSKSEIENLISQAGLNPTPEQLEAMNSGITSQILQQLLNETAAIPTKISDLTNDSDFATNSDVAAVQADLDSHKGNTSNPHSVTKDQVGLDKVANVLQYSEDNPPPYPVSSVAGKTGAVSLSKSDVGLGNVDNTSDADKPVSDAQNAINQTLQNDINTRQPKLLGQTNYSELLLTPPSSAGGQPGTLPRSTFANAAETMLALAGKVDKVSGKQLSANDFTNAFKDKLDGIEAGAQVNSIEGIKINDALVEPDQDKIIDLGAYQTASDAEAMGARITSLEGDLPAKANKVAGATNNHFAGLDAAGDLKDSGYSAASFATAAQGALASTALQPADVDSALDSTSEHPVQNKVLAVLIPSSATSANILADRDWVNSSISNMAARYITSTSAGAPFATKAALTSASTFYSGGATVTLTSNDYCLVTSDETKDNTTTRYSYQIPAGQSVGQWEFQYSLNNTPFNNDQVNAINSGITSEWITTTSTTLGTKLDKKPDSSNDLINASNKLNITSYLAIGNGLSKTSDSLDVKLYGDSLAKSGNGLSLKQDYIDYLENQLYQAPVISVFSVSPNNSPYEVSTTARAITEFIHQETNTSNISSLTIKNVRTGVETAVTPSASSTSVSYADSFTLTTAGATQQYILTSVNSRGTPTTKTVTLSAYIPSYYGKNANSSISASSLSGLSRVNSTSLAGTRSITISSQDGNSYLYFVSTSAITKITDTSTGWDLDYSEQETISTTLNGVSITYRVYRSIQLSSGTYSLKIQ